MESSARLSQSSHLLCTGSLGREGTSQGSLPFERIQPAESDHPDKWYPSRTVLAFLSLPSHRDISARWFRRALQFCSRQHCRLQPPPGGTVALVPTKVPMLVFSANVPNVRPCQTVVPAILDLSQLNR